MVKAKLTHKTCNILINVKTEKFTVVLHISIECEPLLWLNTHLLTHIVMFLNLLTILLKF
jgi:hypothetical protein